MSSVEEILCVLEKKSEDASARLGCYTSITRNFKEDGAKKVGESITRNISRILTVIKDDINGTLENVTQSSLEVLGVCLHDLEIVGSISEQEGSDILDILCKCIHKTENKNVCTRALWCIGKQNLSKNVIQKQVDQILTALDFAADKWKGQSVTVEHECVNTIERLTDQAPSEMSGECARWGKVLLPMVSHSAIKVRDRVLMVVESCLMLIETQRKELTSAVVPVFKSKVIPELKALFNNKQELYVLKCWAVLVQVFGEELHRGSFINDLLPVVEPGFKSGVSTEIMIEAFQAWQQLIDNFALNPDIIGDPKRIKLVMKVFLFKSARAEAESVAVVKLKVWWHYIWMLGNKVSNNFDMVAVPFLHFCVGGSKMAELSSTGTPRQMIKSGNSPATPRMTQWAVMKSLQLYGCEALAVMLGLPDSNEFDHQFNLDLLRFEIVTGPSFFIKHSTLLITSAAELFTSLGKDVPESIVLHIWQWLIAHLKNAIDSPVKLDIRDTLNTLMTKFQLIILSRVLSSSLILSMFRGLCQLPKKVLCSTMYSIKGERPDKTVNGTPALFLMELLLTPVLLQAGCSQETYHTLFNDIVRCGMGNSTCTLGFLQSILEILQTHAEFVEDKEILWRLWSSTVNSLLDNVTATNEVNQGDALEPNFDGTIQALTLPVACKLFSMPMPTVKSMVKTWTDLYKTVTRLAAMVTNAEANVICEKVCHKFLERCKSDEIMEAVKLDVQVQFCQVIVTSLDFSSLDTQSAFNIGKTCALNIGYSPKKFTKKKHRPLENIHSFVSLLARLQDQAVQLAADTDLNKKPGSIPIQGMFNTLVDIFCTLFTHVSSSHIISNMITVLAEPIGRMYWEASKKTSAKVYNNAFQQKLEKLWLDISTCLQTRYTSLYDSVFLKKLSPLLESTFLHSRRQIKNQTLALWASTFSKAASLDYPDDLRIVLTKVKEKSTVQLPGWITMATPVIEETPISQMSQSQAPEARIPGMPSPHKIHGSFLNKAVSPNVRKSPLKSPGSPRPLSKLTNSAKKKVLGWDNDDKDFVVIKSSPKKKMTLTEHQKEVMKERRVIPAMYNNLEISQDVSLMAAHFSGDTQLSSGTPTPTQMLTQPFSMFGSMVPPTAEQQKITSPKQKEVEKEKGNKAKTKDQKKEDSLNSPDESSSSSKTRCRRLVRFKEKAEAAEDTVNQAADEKKNITEAIVIEGSEKMETDSPDKDNVDTVDLTKSSQSQESSSKETSSKDSSIPSSVPQNVLGISGLSQLSGKSSDSKSSKSSGEAFSNVDDKTDKDHTPKDSDKANNELPKLGMKDRSEDEADKITSSEPLMSWTQKLNELSQSPGLRSPVRKALSQETRSPRRSTSPHKSPRRNKKKPTNENEGFGALDKWVIRSPVRASNLQQKLSQEAVVANVTAKVTFVEETQSPTKFIEASKPVDKMPSIMETPPKNVLEDLSLCHGNSSRKLFNSQNGNSELDVMEDSNIVPASPNSKSIAVKTGTPILKVKRLTNEEIKRYSPSRGPAPEEKGTPSGRSEKHKRDRAKCSMNLEKAVDSIQTHVHDDFSDLTPLENTNQADMSSKSITDSEKDMVSLLDKVESIESQDVESQSLLALDNEQNKREIKSSDTETACQDSQEDDVSPGGGKRTRKTRNRKQETPKQKSPEERRGRKKKTEALAMSATKVSARIKERKLKAEQSKTDLNNSDSLENKNVESQDIFENSQESPKTKNETSVKIGETNDISNSAVMETDSVVVPDGEALDGSQLMEVDDNPEEAELIVESNKDLSAYEDHRHLDPDCSQPSVGDEEGGNESKTEDDEKSDKEIEGKKKRGVANKVKKTKEKKEASPKTNAKKKKDIDDDSKFEKEKINDMSVVSQNTPEAKISSKEPERRSTTKRKKVVAQKMVKRSKDTLVNQTDSNLDMEISDEDIPQINLNKIVGENLEKKLNAENPAKAVESDSSVSDKVNDIECSVEVEKSAVADTDKDKGDKNTFVKDRNSSISDDDDVPLIAIKEKIDHKQKRGRKKKDKTISEPVSPVGNKLRSSAVKVTRLRSGEKKNRVSPQSKRSVKLAVKRARNVEAKKKLIDDKNKDSEIKKDEIETDKSDQVESEIVTEEIADKVVKVDEKYSEKCNGIEDNCDALRLKEKFGMDQTNAASLDETPKKDKELITKASQFQQAGYSDSKLVLGSRRFNRKSVIARRSILKVSNLRSVGDVASPKRKDFHPITLGRIYSPTASPSASILKKRRLTDDSESETSSPPAKQRRVSFAEPLEAEGLTTEAAPSSPLVKDSSDKTTDQDQDTAGCTQASSGRSDTQGSLGFGSQSQASYHSTQESQLDPTEPVYPELKSCSQAVEKVLPQLTSSIWSRGLGQLMRARNIQTIGDLSTLSETDIQSLPIRSPKVQTVRKVLDKFTQNQKAKAVKLWGSTKTDTPTVNKQRDDKISSAEPTKLSAIEPKDKQVNPSDIEAILASSGDLIDEVNRLSQNFSQSQSQPMSCDTNESQSQPSVSAAIGSKPSTTQSQETSFIDTLKGYSGKQGDILNRLRVDELFQAHQYLSNLQNSVVSALKNRCHSPSGGK